MSDLIYSSRARGRQAARLALHSHSRPMPAIGPRCHELRIQDESLTWRIIFRLDADAVVVAEVARKKTQRTPQSILEACKRRLAQFDRDLEESKS